MQPQDVGMAYTKYRKESYMSVIENVKKIASDKNISLSRLENDSGLGNGTIGKWKDSMPNVSTISKVATVLEVPIEDLLKE